jgi:D-tyrosyl-tRNA(Tyr) deacylase
MRVLIQRVGRAAVRAEGRVIGEIGRGLLVLVGATHDDDERAAEWLAHKVAGLRLFPDSAGRMNLDVREVGGGVLVVPQFTLYADARKGRRPDFVQAAPPERAAPLVERFAAALASQGVPVARGRFGVHMEVELLNDGPVTLLLESPEARGR